MGPPIVINLIDFYFYKNILYKKIGGSNNRGSKSHLVQTQYYLHSVNMRIGYSISSVPVVHKSRSRVSNFLAIKIQENCLEMIPIWRH